MKKIILASLLVLSALLIKAAPPQGEQVPVDPDYRIGKLDNGLTYYIRHNTEPAGRASYYIIQNVGAILEKDNQNGLAHFLEHMAFNGTKHFPGKTLLSTLEKHGVAFGRNINAYTSFDETVYNLSDVPVDKPGLIDTCLMILADWSDFLTLDEEEINKERGVILEEWRSRRNAQWRMLTQMLPVVYEGSMYAKRDIIGDTAVINNFDPETLRAFYHDWYRTDLQAIAVVGDFNVDEVEAKIREIFSPIPAIENPIPRPENLLAPKKGTTYLLVTDPEAPRTTVSLMILDARPDTRERDLDYIREGYITSLMNAMMNNRFSEIVQKGTPPFIAGGLSYSADLPRNYNALTLAAYTNDGQEAGGFEAAVTELERARRHGFTQGELNRARAEMLSNFENLYKQKDKISNDEWASQIRDHFLTGEPLPSLDLQYDYYKKILPEITVKEVNSRLQELVKDDNRFIYIQGPDDKEHMTEAEAMAIIEKVTAADIKPYEDVTGGTDLISGELTGAEIVNSVPLPQFGATEWTLANGAKVVFRHADYEKDNVTISGYAFGGSSFYPDSLEPALNLFPTVVSMYGAGEFDNVALTKMLAGKKASVSLGIQETMQTVTGTSTPKDFETMMQLLYLRFARPNFNKEAYDAIMGRFKAVITMMLKDPNKIMSDSLSMNMSNYHPRTFLMTPESMNLIQYEDINYIYETAFDDASAFTFFITGNIEEAVARDMASLYIGALPSKYQSETYRNLGMEQPEGTVRKEIPIPLTVPKATVIMSYSADSKYKPSEYLAMDVLKGILDLVYTEKVREEEGGTYGVSVNASVEKRPEEKSMLMIAFECNPERAEELKAIIYKELEDITKNGPRQIDLDKTVSNMLKTREEELEHNSYWANTIRNYYLNGIDRNDSSNYADILNKLTVKKMKKAAKKFLSKADLLEMVFVPEKK
ncbi:MAG: insulinase family protein [Bacteroidales bacterium]|nr:insulinase family protein [Bacteroidales bacterium]HOO66023.1 insulinase family protein [Bacteroidales bacterium]HPE22142.1 insulinase family protein [Bacteroidales bacterium]HPJ05465.1 insulinase family protein [Bacteroidales bacterium]HPQ64057.1 insulinase family protein [Bacteroidales bacterium]